MENKVHIIQYHRHDVKINMMTYVIYQHLDLFSDIEGENVIITHDFNRIIGKTTCINTDNIDRSKIYYAIRGNRKYKSRMVRDVEAQYCSSITIVVRRYKWECQENVNLLHLHVATSYIGFRAPREFTEIEYKSSIGQIDFTEDEKKEALDFWNHHALIE